LNIRTAAEQDIDAVARIFREASLVYESQRPLLEAHPEVLEFDADCIRSGNTVVAEVNGAVVAFATARLCDGFYELDDLFVDPAQFRRGIASALIRDIATDAHRRGIPRIEVTANTNALPFYEAAGFVTDGVVDTPLGESAPRMHLDV
jgi:GNAT superfamily N-acetyltransferase